MSQAPQPAGSLRSKLERAPQGAQYAALHERFRRVGDLRHALAMLAWDEAAIMPAGGGPARADALATLRGMAHELTAAPEVGELVAAAGAEDLDAWQAANVACIGREWQRSSAVPKDLEVALSKACSACEQTWRGARAANDWAAVRGQLETVFDLTRERAAVLAEALDCAPYDALLDGYEPGFGRADVEPLFAELAAALPALIDNALAAQPAALPLPGPFPVEKQAALCTALMRAVGFDFAYGRLDTSHHPFCGGEPDDTRITTRYNEGDFLESMFAVLHESGHALYQQGLPKAWRGQPVGEAGGMALHESQSLTMEMQVCRSEAFLEFAAPLIQRALLGGVTEAPEWQPANLAKHARRVARGFIRVDADELTYPLHVILRYELETQLVAGSLSVADLPDAWDAAMRRHLGLSTAGDFADGVMQDVHWFAGLIGYFPCYTLGAVMAAQLQRAARERLGDLTGAIRAGEFGVLLRWQREHIHERGRLLPTKKLLRQVTGRELGAEAFLRHLRARYADGH